MEEPSEEDLNQFLGFSQVFKLLVDSVSKSLYMNINTQ